MVLQNSLSLTSLSFPLPPLSLPSPSPLPPLSPLFSLSPLLPSPPLLPSILLSFLLVFSHDAPVIIYIAAIYMYVPVGQPLEYSHVLNQTNNWYGAPPQHTYVQNIRISLVLMRAWVQWQSPSSVRKCQMGCPSSMALPPQWDPLACQRTNTGSY